MPSFLFGQSIFWIAYASLFLWGLIQLAIMWRSYRRSFAHKQVNDLHADPVKFYVRPVLITFFVLAAFGLVVLNQGGTANSTTTKFQPDSAPKPAFTEAYDQGREALKPNTPESLEAKRQAEAEQKKAADDRARAQQNGQLGADMKDFRKIVEERGTVPSSLQPDTSNSAH